MTNSLNFKAGSNSLNIMTLKIGITDIWLMFRKLMSKKLYWQLLPSSFLDSIYCFRKELKTLLIIPSSPLPKPLCECFKLKFFSTTEFSEHRIHRVQNIAETHGTRLPSHFELCKFLSFLRLMVNYVIASTIFDSAHGWL